MAILLFCIYADCRTSDHKSQKNTKGPYFPYMMSGEKNKYTLFSTPVYNNLCITDHVDDDLLWGGTEVSGPAVNEGSFYESWFFGHFSPEMFERDIVSHCRDTSCIEKSCEVGCKNRASHNDCFVVKDHVFVDGPVNRRLDTLGSGFAPGL